MSSKIFKSAVSEGRLSIAEAPNRRFTVGIRRNGVATDMVDIAPSDAPALALAILEAAGYSEDDRKASNPLCVTEFASAIIKLAEGIENQERIAAEAEAQAKLEAEALELMNVRLRASGTTVHLTKATVDPVALEGWLAVARRAREMRTEK